MGKIKMWTKEEYDFLKENYYNYGLTWCSKELGRSKGATQKKVKQLNLKFGGVKSKYHKDNLECISKSCKSISEMLRELDMCITGGNANTIKKYIEKYSLDISHFDVTFERDLKLNEYLNTIKIPINEILVEKSSYNRTLLKKRLISEKLLEYKCVKCTNVGEWLGEPITLQLDHINGINNDNRLENLRFLCPNCHSQTKTYAGRNSKS